MSKKKDKSDHDKLSKQAYGAPDSDLFFGNGEFTLPNGDVYVGDYCAHRSGVLWRQGRGIYKTQDGQTYEGEWWDDKLIENKEIIITYPNGAKYYGCIMKNNYNGPGTYTLESNMNLSCEFSNNKPLGIITLIDREGKLWVGDAKENSALLLPENIFYLNLSDLNGKGLSTKPLKDIYGISSSSLSSYENNEEITDREWEKTIFIKSNLTRHDINFTECKWWKKYEEFKKRYNEIENKIANNINLNEEDYAWLHKFKKYKRKLQIKKDQKKLKQRKEEQKTFELNEKLDSKDFIDSCPPVKVLYPSAWDNSDDEELSDKQLEIDSEDFPLQSANLIVIKSSKTVNLDVSNFPKSLAEEDNTIQLKKLKQYSNEEFSVTSDANLKSNRTSKNTLAGIESEELELHFTPFREEMLFENKLELKEQKQLDSEKQVKLKVEEDVDQSKTKPSYTKIDKDYNLKRKEDRSAPEIVEAKNNYLIEQPVLNKKEKIENKIKDCVTKFLLEHKEKKMQTKKDVKRTENSIHTHNIAVHTESLTGIPPELLLKR